MSEPYRVESHGVGCPTCSNGEEWDIIGPDDSAQSQTWGDQEEATYICTLLNIAYQHGRISYIDETLEKLKGELNASKKVEVVEEPKPFNTKTLEEPKPFNTKTLEEPKPFNTKTLEEPKPFNTKTLEGEDIPF